jgi:arylformamidase
MTPLEADYSPSTCVASLDDELDAYRLASHAARDTLPHRVVPYGNHPDEWSVVFDADGASTLLIFIHGGYWQALSAWESLMPAPACIDRGVSFAAVNYTLAPHATIGEIIDQVRRATATLIEVTGCAAVIVAGSSAGAHLAAHVAQHEPRIGRTVLLSGVYQLTPLVHTYINDALGLTEEQAAAWSVDLTRRPAGEVIIVHGEHETRAFKAQSAAAAAAWNLAVVEVARRNHFDLVFELPALALDDGPARPATD